jgi:hypothetical protein
MKDALGHEEFIQGRGTLLWEGVEDARVDFQALLEEEREQKEEK